MAQSTGVLNGSLIGVYLDGTLVAAGTSHTLSTTTGVRDTTNKDNDGWRSVMPGVKSWTVSGSHMYQFSSTGKDFADLFTIYANRTKVTLVMASSNAADEGWSGSAFISSLTLDAPSEENTTYSYTFEGDGTLSTYTTT